ncbi:hypothetical protein AB0395_42665 [Streptosporangium sp. NPDC051023]|uniref:hypothetical protein n=1 Tax=Streptosporangium sp. NPDC051023 TaxID=3155410 RepID=UPI00344F6F46
MRVLIALLVVVAAALPAPAEAEPGEGPVIRSVTLTPEDPVVGPVGVVRLVIEVVAKGVAGPDGVTIEVEPGGSPGTGGEQAPAPLPAPVPQPLPDQIPTPLPTQVPTPPPGQVPPPLPGQTPVSGEPSGPQGQGSGIVSPTGAPVSAGVAGVAGRRMARAFAPEGARRSGRGWETWRFLPDKELTRWYPAGRWTVTVTARGSGGAVATERAVFRLRRETRFSAVQAVAGDAGVRVRGVLNRVDPQGYLDYAPFPGQPVDILHRRARGDAWESVASATTDAQGRFIRNVAGAEAGEWRIWFAGTGHYAARRSIIHPTTP